MKQDYIRFITYSVLCCKVTLINVVQLFTGHEQILFIKFTLMDQNEMLNEILKLKRKYLNEMLKKDSLSMISTIFLTCIVQWYHSLQCLGYYDAFTRKTMHGLNNDVTDCVNSNILSTKVH